MPQRVHLENIAYPLNITLSISKNWLQFERNQTRHYLVAYTINITCLCLQASSRANPAKVWDSLLLTLSSVVYLSLPFLLQKATLCCFTHILLVWSKHRPTLHPVRVRFEYEYSLGTNFPEKFQGFNLLRKVFFSDSLFLSRYWNLSAGSKIYYSRL